MATYKITSNAQLVKIFETKTNMALQMTQNEIFNVIQKYISDYYKEPVFGGSNQPLEYDRKYKFLNSLIKTSIISSGNSISCTVEVDPNYLNYEYMAGNQGFTGFDSWFSADNALHGYTVHGDIQVWKDSMMTLGNREGVIALMKKNLKKCGIPVK